MSTIAVGRPARTVRPTRRAASVPTARPETPVRLTRRGRVVVLLAFVGLAFAAFTVFGGHSAATGEAGEPVPTRTVVVAEGDTLWAIASTVAEPGEVREMIHQIQELNALPSAGLSEGQKLAVPVS